MLQATDAGNASKAPQNLGFYGSTNPYNQSSGSLFGRQAFACSLRQGQPNPGSTSFPWWNRWWMSPSAGHIQHFASRHWMGRLFSNKLIASPLSFFQRHGEIASYLAATVMLPFRPHAWGEKSWSIVVYEKSKSCLVCHFFKGLIGKKSWISHASDGLPLSTVIYWLLWICVIFASNYLWGESGRIKKFNWLERSCLYSLGF